MIKFANYKYGGVEMKEKLVIKNFGPITSAEIEIKKMMVFIGDSGSGKSVVLKLLSLFRWIFKKLSIDSQYKFDDCEKILIQSGLLDFCTNGSEATYYVDEKSCITISCKNEKYKIDHSQYESNSVAIYEKVSFISDERIILPSVLNHEIRISRYPYHLEKTYEDLDDAIREYFSKKRKIQINTMNIKLLKKKEGITNIYYLEDQKNALHFHNASSGMKSASIIEIITSSFVQNYEKAKEDFQEDIILNYLKKEHTKDKNLRHIDLPQIGEKLSSLEYHLSFFIEEPELSLFPVAQKRLIDYLVALTFEEGKNIRMAFSTHSPYILTSLNCLLKAYQLAEKFPSLENKIKKIVDEKYWLNPKEFDAFVVENGGVHSICKEENEDLILAEKIDEVSDEIRDIFDRLIDLELEMED